jgi:hypothetical protein
MRTIRRLLLIAAFLPGLAWADCPPEGVDADGLKALKVDGFAIEDAAERQALALGLADCLADPDPALRDGIAYEALTTWLRGDVLDADTRRALLDRLLPWIAADAEPGEGFRAPFAALALSEVARTDRIAAWLDPAARDGLVEAAADYVESVDDYRGFDAEQGWRHGVAHGADLLMQLALNPALTAKQRTRLLDAVATQVAPDGEHFYVYGEPERLARPVLFVLGAGDIDAATWRSFLEKVTASAPLDSWRDAYASQAGLAKRHNTRAFLLALYTGTLGSDDPEMQAFAAAIAEVLRTVG